jgi:hypothetical protein
MRLTNYYLGVYFFTYVTTNHWEASSSADSDISDRYDYGGGVDRFYNQNVKYIYTISEINDRRYSMFQEGSDMPSNYHDHDMT